MNRVHVLGNAGIDFGLFVPRMPAPGETLVGTDPHRAPGGKGLNQAVAAARAGARVRFLAPLGQDADGMEVARALEGEPFDAVDLPRLPCPTDRSILMLTPDGENCIVTAGSCADALDPTLAWHFAAGVQPGDILLLQGNLSLAATRAAIDANPGHTILNAAPLRWDVRPFLPSCAVLVANLVEASSVTGSRSAAALHAAGAAVAVVTLGSEGCLVADPHGERHLPASPARLLDSTGAGDAFCGTLAALLADGWPIDQAVMASQRMAARTVERRGAMAALPSAAEAMELIKATLSRG